MRRPPPSPPSPLRARVLRAIEMARAGNGTDTRVEDVRDPEKYLQAFNRVGRRLGLPEV